MRPFRFPKPEETGPRSGMTRLFPGRRGRAAGECFLSAAAPPARGLQPAPPCGRATPGNPLGGSCWKPALPQKRDEPATPEIFPAGLPLFLADAPEVLLPPAPHRDHQDTALPHLREERSPHARRRRGGNPPG